MQYSTLNPEPYLPEIELDVSSYERADYLEWARLRGGATDFSESPGKRCSSAVFLDVLHPEMRRAFFPRGGSFPNLLRGLLSLTKAVVASRTRGSRFPVTRADSNI